MGKSQVEKKYSQDICLTKDLYPEFKKKHTKLLKLKKKKKKNQTS